MLRLTWDDFDRAVDALAAQMPASARVLLPVPRGGLALAVALSHRTGLPLLLLNEPPFYPPPGAVLVDDIVDQGVTLARWRAACWRQELPCLAWLRREGRVFSGVTAAAEAPEGSWVLFPWESAEAAAEDEAAYRDARKEEAAHVG